MSKKLECIKKGCALNDKIFLEAVKKIKQKELRTEKQVANFVDSEFSKAGAKNAFPTIVASGKHAVEWHWEPKNSKLLNGFCVIDFGSRFSGYCSDMTRTIHIGKASKTDKRLYSLVKKTQEKCIKQINAGKEGNDIYLLAKKSLGAYADYFGHGLGHGLTTLIHANPRISKNKAKLMDGDIVTIEPGIYIPNVLGIRIEDDILVKKSGFAVLSNSTKKLIEIK
ncbi:MAG: hypothetical protein COV47_03000 [Candidatus Diapherotrites archaeon CG11_big_fil_rev_8_21_14_0_20_37_9]|nr:MAG: hypothetical protein COV47_03000 [Candidatus Diapherotrites archaeon CG11_big_fil_rev_8_21_14_0_20_37_9]